MWYQFPGILSSKVQGNVSRNAVGSREVGQLLLIQPYMELAAPGILVLLLSVSYSTLSQADPALLSSAPCEAVKNLSSLYVVLQMPPG